MTPTTDQTRILLRHIEPRPDYETWLRVISAVGNTFDEQTALLLLLERFIDEKPNEHLYKLRHRLPKTGFGSLVWLAEQRGFKPSADFFFATENEIRQARKARRVVSKPRISFEEVQNKNYLIFDDNNQRIFRLALNRYVVDKTKDYDLLNAGFQNAALSAHGIAAAVRQGWAICNATLHGNRRCNQNFLNSELVFIDVDSGMSLEDAMAHRTTQDALIIYTTASHTEYQHRFRILFALPHIETDVERYRVIVKALQNDYRADPAPSAVVQTFYGSSKGKIWLVEGGQYVEF